MGSLQTIAYGVSFVGCCLSWILLLAGVSECRLCLLMPCMYIGLSFMVDGQAYRVVLIVYGFLPTCVSSVSRHSDCWKPHGPSQSVCMIHPAQLVRLQVQRSSGA
jgi:hypothetical protein